MRDGIYIRLTGQVNYFFFLCCLMRSQPLKLHVTTQGILECPIAA
jgi:hypothetical protein